MIISKNNQQKGVTILELVLVVFTIGFMALLINNLPGAVKSISISKHLSIAKNIADKEVEYLRRQTYGNLTNGAMTFTDLSLSNLPQGSASYTISDCPVSICTQGESVKQAQVTVSWKEEGKVSSVNLYTLISDGGLGQ